MLGRMREPWTWVELALLALLLPPTVCQVHALVTRPDPGEAPDGPDRPEAPPEQVVLEGPGDLVVRELARIVVEHATAERATFVVLAAPRRSLLAPGLAPALLDAWRDARGPAPTTCVAFPVARTRTDALVARRDGDDATVPLGPTPLPAFWSDPDADLWRAVREHGMEPVGLLPDEALGVSARPSRDRWPRAPVDAFDEVDRPMAAELAARWERGACRYGVVLARTGQVPARGWGLVDELGAVALPVVALRLDEDADVVFERVVGPISGTETPLVRVEVALAGLGGTGVAQVGRSDGRVGAP